MVVVSLNLILSLQVFTLTSVNPLEIFSLPGVNEVDDMVLSSIASMGKNALSVPPWVFLATVPTRSWPLPLAEIKYYNYFTASVYSGIDPEDVKLECCYCQYFTRTMAYHRIIENPSAQTKVLVTVHPSLKEIVVTFRGSTKLSNVIADFNLEPVPMRVGVMVNGRVQMDNVGLHSGFFQCQNSLYPQVRNELSRLLSYYGRGYRVVITGHSLGAAMASITLLRLYYETPLLILGGGFDNYVLVNYGSPRVGDFKFAHYMNQIPVPMARVVHAADCVAHYVPIEPPMSAGRYVHHKHEVWDLDNGTAIYCGGVKNPYGWEDKDCSDSLLPNVKAMDHVRYFNVDYIRCLISPMVCDPVNFFIPVNIVPRVANKFCQKFLGGVGTIMDRATSSVSQFWNKGRTVSSRHRHNAHQREEEEWINKGAEDDAYLYDEY